MTTEDFIAKWNGKYVDFDGVYGNQCMDLMHQFCTEVLGITDGTVLAAPSARDVYLNFPNVPGAALFDKIDNTPTGVPQEGDIIFWINAPYGHVAVFHDGDANSFRSFDQNYPTGSPCHIQNHPNYTNVGGWLRFKGSSSIQADLDQCRIDRDSHWNDRIAIANKLGVENNMTVILAELDKLIGFEDAVVQKDQQLTTTKQQVADLQAQVMKLQQEKNTADDQITEMQKKVDDTQAEYTGKLQDLQDRYNALDAQLSTVSGALQDLKTHLIDGLSGWQLIQKGIGKLFGRG